MISRRELGKWTVGMLAGWLLGGRAAAAEERRTPRLSDIVFDRPHYDFFRSNIYQPYGVNWVAWGFLPLIRGQTNMAGYLKAIERHQAAGIAFQARIEWDAVRNGMPIFAPEHEEAAIRDLNGDIVRIPWFGGEPWFCSHQPLFQSYLRYQIDLALSGKDEGLLPDSLMFDCQTATPLTYRYGGCFCDRCRVNFRNWLRLRQAEGKLALDEAPDLQDFDYGQYLRARGYSVENYNEAVKRWPNAIPLTDEYRLFQLQYLQRHLSELLDYARQQAGDELTFSASAPLTDATRLLHHEAISHYTLEVNHHADRQAPADEVFLHYRLAEAIQRPLMLTALPNPDWLTMALENRPNLARSWIAQAYASGALFMAPIEQWAYRDSNHLWYRSRPGEYAEIYQFIQRQRDLLAGYRAISRIALLYVHAAFRRNPQTTIAAVKRLTRASVPFHLHIAGDEWWPFPVSDPAEANFARLITTADVIRLNPAQRQYVASLGERAQSFNDFRASDGWHEWRVHCGAAGVIALPRYHPGDLSAPAVCHLLNRNYDAAAERFLPPGPFRLRIPRAIYGQGFWRAILHEPGREKQSLTVMQDADFSELALPNLDYWAMLELS